MDFLDEDSKIYSKNWQAIASQFKYYEKRCKELQEIVDVLNQSIEMYKKGENQHNDQVNSLHQICANQENVIHNLINSEKKNEVFASENILLKETINDLKMKIETQENETKKTIQELEEKLESVHAVNDLQVNEHRKEIYNLANNYEKKLKTANDLQIRFKNEISTLNNKINLNDILNKKKILELEAKNKQYEKDRTNYGITKGSFVSAQKIYSNSQSLNKNPSLERVSSSNIIDKKSQKHFNIRKNTYNEYSNGSKENESIQTVETNSSESFNKSEDENFTNANCDTTESNQKNKKQFVFKNKKRKIFNPNNYDYMN